MESSTIQNQAAVIREFVKHPGMQLLEEKLTQRLNAKKYAWLNAKSADEAEMLDVMLLLHPS